MEGKGTRPRLFPLPNPGRDSPQVQKGVIWQATSHPNGSNQRFYPQLARSPNMVLLCVTPMIEFGDG